MYESAAVAASPASFQPLKAHTITGARSSGRSRQITSSSTSRYPTSDPAITIGAVTIAELRAGGEVEGVFACTRKDRLTARNGSPYLAVELRDRTGAIPGRAFRDADFLAAQFERGDLVTVSGRVERFRDELQVELKTIKRAREEASDPAEFLPVAYRDMEELDGFLEHLAREVYDADLRAPARLVPRRRRVPRRVPARALHPLGPPRLPRRADRAHRRGRHARLRDLRAAPAAQLRPAPVRGDPARRRARRSSSSSAPRSPSARRARWWAT